ncbi:Spore maturation protein A [Poriferisphaera corsica]|uniref:Spore maturation protein A n=1 Tax=Poriferisphaera corsica TaxID=2528020 RepID=A0A517YXZ3_9BACT|nr:nucleoside recognition domain-containing protein [Poriferisphaera corsica]QDU35102.1 Spore maturation protein A [Poriferisphaera corsica]
MNYVWAALIIVSLGFAIWADAGDIASDKYRNKAPFPINIEMVDRDLDNGPQDATVSIDAEAYMAFYKLDQGMEKTQRQDALKQLQTVFNKPFKGKISKTESGAIELRFALNSTKLPEPMATVYKDNKTKNGDFLAKIDKLPETAAGLATLNLAPSRFLSIKSITDAAFDFADVAVTISLGLIGVLALWLGLMNIADKAGLINAFCKLISPVLRPLFPEVPKGHPAYGMLALACAANALGTGNAATPMGIKAMEELQKLSKKKDTATNSMVMLLAMSTASLQITPSATLLAVLGVAAADLLVAILIVTAISAVIAIITARLMSKLPMFAKTNPGHIDWKPGDDDEGTPLVKEKKKESVSV